MTTGLPSRPVPRAVRVVAVVLAMVALLPLALGGLTTSFKAGMSDPTWPSEPWFLIVNGHKYELKRNAAFLMEHTHRLAAWITGGLASLLAVLAWWSAADKRTRYGGLVVIVGLLATYGDFHRRMMAVMEFRQDHPGESLTYPVAQGLLTAAFAATLIGLSIAHLFGRERGKWVRSLSGVVLVAVMIQGLLGGFRVFLDQIIGLTNTIGVEFSQLHGIFAQMVFTAMVCVPLLAARPRPEFDLPDSERTRVGALSLALVAAVLLQLLWAVWVRHSPTPLAQRLHFLTAFVVFGVCVWLSVRVMSSPDSRKCLGFDARHLIGMLAVQILLGVEAWMMKFGTPAAFAELVASDARPISVGSGAVRTLHQLIGTAILASAVVIVLRVYRRTGEPPATEEVPALRQDDPLAPSSAQA